MAKKVKDTTLSKEVAARLQTYRKLRGMTLEELAYEADMELTQVHRVLAGTHDNQLSTIAKICTSLGVSFEELFKGL